MEIARRRTPPRRSPPLKVGFIGLGTIGNPIAANVAEAGFDLSVHDLRREAMEALARAGAKTAGSPKAVAERSEIVCVAVVDDAQVEQVVAGYNGILAGARAGSVVAIHSTVFPETVQKMAQLAKARGVHVLDAPVSGGQDGARERALCFMVGGKKELLERCRPVFAASGPHIFHLGDLGAGASAKMILQVVVCINMLAAHEAERLCQASGLDFAALREVVRVSSAQSFVVDQWLSRFQRPGDPLPVRRQRTEVFKKSLSPALEMARELGVELNGAALALRLLSRIMGLDQSR